MRQHTGSRRPAICFRQGSPAGVVGREIREDSGIDAFISLLEEPEDGGHDARRPESRARPTAPNEDILDPDGALV